MKQIDMRREKERVKVEIIRDKGRKKGQIGRAETDREKKERQQS